MDAVVSENKSFEWTRTDGRTENRTPILHLAKAGATNDRFYLSINLIPSFT